jgi:hypothetical protein
MAGNTLIPISNPMWSGSARKSAEGLLRLLQAKNIEAAFGRFPLLARSRLEDNMFDPPTRWILDDIVADPNDVLDIGNLNETASHAMGGYIWIYCTRDKQGSWTVSRFNRVF